MFGISHGAALIATVTAALWMIRLNQADPQQARRANVVLASVMFLSVWLDPVWTWWRFGSDPAEAWIEIKKNSLPVHLCDVVALMLSVALLTRRQRLTELCYLWGLSGTIQGLITPGLHFDFPAPEYFSFFLQHGGVPVAALTLVFGAGLRPQKGALWRGFAGINGYLAAIFAINALLGTNYGYVNHKPDHPSLLDFLGPWPWYLLVLELLAFVFFSMLLLPFRKEWKSAAQDSSLPQR